MVSCGGNRFQREHRKQKHVPSVTHWNGINQRAEREETKFQDYPLGYTSYDFLLHSKLSACRSVVCNQTRYLGITAVILQRYTVLLHFSLGDNVSIDTLEGKYSNANILKKE